MSDVNETAIFGSFEYVSLPQFGIRNVVAKIDTGAYSGALHCGSIKVKKRPDGTKLLTFIPSKNNDQVMETTEYKEIFVRSSNGHRSKRYVISTEIIVQGKSYNITIGLADRSDMQREILIGRRFLRENNILVDTRIRKELDNDGGENI